MLHSRIDKELGKLSPYVLSSFCESIRIDLLLQLSEGQYIWIKAIDHIVFFCPNNIMLINIRYAHPLVNTPFNVVVAYSNKNPISFNRTIHISSGTTTSYHYRLYFEQNLNYYIQLTLPRNLAVYKENQNPNFNPIYKCICKVRH